MPRDFRSTQQIEHEASLPLWTKVGGGTGVTIAFLLLVGWMSYFTVSQGYEGVVTRFGAARYVEGPGLHFKVPFMDSVVHIDTRELTNSETLDAASNRNLPVIVKFSQNWVIKPGMTLEFYKLYGDRARFESVILDPRVREVAKGAIASFNPEILLQQRQLVSTKIDTDLAKDLARYPIQIVSSQIEDVQFPKDIIEQIRAKEKAREMKEQEQFELERQNLIAQRNVQTARADAEAVELKSAAEAKAKLTVGEAEAKVIQLVQQALAQSPQYNQYKMIERWQGQFPTTFMGGGDKGMNMLFQLPTNEGRK